MKDKYQVSLKVIMKNDQGQYLGLKTPPDSSLGGSYEFAGGRIDAEEFETSFEDIVHREITEELGDIQYDLNSKPVALGRHKISSDGTHVLYVFFEAIYKSGDIVISDEHEGYDWLDLANADLEDLFRSGNLDGIKMYLDKLCH